MNKAQAIAVDKDENGKVQVHIDEQDNVISLYGINSGWAYCSQSDPYKWVEDHPNFIMI